MSDSQSQSSFVKCPKCGEMNQPAWDNGYQCVRCQYSFAYGDKYQDSKIGKSLFGLTRKAWEEVIAQREEITRAFIAKYGIEPDEIEQVEERGVYEIVWYVRRREARHTP
jgi:hypothetical protein